MTDEVTTSGVADLGQHAGMSDEPLLIPVRMLNELVYCPRLFSLEFVHREWAESADTVEGSSVHRRVDSPTRAGLPDDVGEEESFSVRSVMLSDEALGLIGRLDLVELDGGCLAPVDYKRGQVPDVPEGAWEPERVQVCAQGLLLRAHGYRCDRGFLYFAESRRRVEVVLSEELVEATLGYISRAMAIAEAQSLPEPLVDSPKCGRCSLVSICMPDEHNLLTGGLESVRPLLPARDDGLPLYVRQHGGRVGKRGEEIVVLDRDKREVGRARFIDTSRVVVLGSASISTPLLRALAERDIAVAFHSYSGWFYGLYTSAGGKNAPARVAQFGHAADDGLRVRLARRFVVGKMKNSRVLLRRNGQVSADRMHRLKELVVEAERASTVEALFGIEGVAARMYFEAFPTMLRGSLAADFHFAERNRRPPLDPINCLLSFGYACLAREITAILHGVGLDPFVGFLHAVRFGRPSLALDLMEEFRPIIVDSAVLTAVNNGMVTRGHFTLHPTGVGLTRAGKAAFVKALEARFDELARHPVFGTRLSYRRIIEVQARLVIKVLLGELEQYPPFVVR